MTHVDWHTGTMSAHQACMKTVRTIHKILMLGHLAAAPTLKCWGLTNHKQTYLLFGLVSHSLSSTLALQLPPGGIWPCCPTALGSRRRILQCRNSDPKGERGTTLYCCQAAWVGDYEKHCLKVIILPVDQLAQQQRKCSCVQAIPEKAGLSHLACWSGLADNKDGQLSGI